MNWKAPISLTTKPKDAQFYARLNADDAWKHKYKQFCFSWSQGAPLKEPPREFAILDQTTAARNAAIATAQRMQEAQKAEAARRQAEAADKLAQQLKQQRDEVDAVAILSGFAFAEKEKVVGEAKRESPTGAAAAAASESSDTESPANASDSGAEAEAEEAAQPPPPPLVTLAAVEQEAARLVAQGGKRRKRVRDGQGDTGAASAPSGKPAPKRRSLKQDLAKSAKAPGLQWCPL